MSWLSVARADECIKVLNPDPDRAVPHTNSTYRNTSWVRLLIDRDGAVTVICSCQPRASESAHKHDDRDRGRTGWLQGLE